MNRIVLLGVGTALLGAAGCANTSESYIDMYARSMAMETNSRGEAIGVVDRSDREQTMTIAIREEDGAVTDGSVTVAGNMMGGTSVPGDDNMPVGRGSRDAWIPNFSNSDSFLTQVREGDNYALAMYETEMGNRRFVTYGVTQGNETPRRNMPVAGTATYNGSAHGTVYGSRSGEAELDGRLSLAAGWAPGGGSIGGKITDIRLNPKNGARYRADYDIVMEATRIRGNEYRDGNMYIANRGSNAEVGSTTGRYDGTFFGGRYRETAGTFSFSSRGIPAGGGRTERIEGVGAFGGRR